MCTLMPVSACVLDVPAGVEGGVNVILRISLGKFDGGRRAAIEERGREISVGSGERTALSGCLKPGNGESGDDGVGIRAPRFEDGRSMDGDPSDRGAAAPLTKDAGCGRGLGVGEIAEPPIPYDAILNLFVSEFPHAPAAATFSLSLLDVRCGLSSSARSGSRALKSKVASGSEVWGSPVIVSLPSDPLYDEGGGTSASSTMTAPNQPSAVVRDSVLCNSADILERERSRLEVLGEGLQEVREYAVG